LPVRLRERPLLAGSDFRREFTRRFFVDANLGAAAAFLAPLPGASVTSTLAPFLLSSSSVLLPHRRMHCWRRLPGVSSPTMIGNRCSHMHSTQIRHKLYVTGEREFGATKCCNIFCGLLAFYSSMVYRASHARLTHHNPRTLRRARRAQVEIVHHGER
jgi:hypothetical protein